MEQFKSYVVDEFKPTLKNFAAVEFKFNHSSNIKIDKKSNIPLKSDIIKVSVKFVDKNLITLKNALLTFENNALNKSCAKKLVNIAPAELENKFNVARREICNEILRDLIEKNNEINTKISALHKYIGSDSDEIISSEFKGELINVVDSSEINIKTKNKQKFDM